MLQNRAMRPPEEPVPLITMPNWVKAAAACGFSIGEVYGELGIEADLVHVESATVSRTEMERIMAACVARSKRRHFPFVLGETFAFEYVPELETFLATSSTLRESTRVFEWIRALINPYVGVSFHEEGERVSLRLDGPDANQRSSFQWFVEATFVSVLKFGRTLLRGRGDFRRATFRCARPAYAAQFAEVFRVPIAFGQAHNALELDRSLLDLRLDGAFETLHRQAEQRVVQRISQRPEASVGVRAKLERVMERRPALLGQGIAQVAGELGLHPRTLQRRLRAEQLGFAELQAELRLRLAKNWLEEGALDIETISERLGFADRRSFTRAFTRWAGVTPSVFRRA
ncbi:MAG: AraC family transcriptional regulator ligand-binding domain-containing protein [Panacagrimonas sp.]